MATTFVLPSGARVTRAWGGSEFRFELHADGPIVELARADLRVLAELGELGAHDEGTMAQFRELDVKLEHVDPETLEVTKS